MKRELHEIWKEKVGSKTWWCVQAPKGIMSFYTRKEATAWVEASKAKPETREYSRTNISKI